MDEKWKSQLRKGFLELCVLSLLRKKTRAYGLDILDCLRLRGLDIVEGTIYPLLTRLASESLVEACWETPEIGHPRKYYALSPGGVERLGAMEAEYAEQRRILEAIAQEA